MKNAILIMFIMQLIYPQFVNATERTWVEEIAGYDSLSLCEKTILKSFPDQTKAIFLTGAQSLGMGTSVGGFVYLFGSAMESASSSSEAAFGALNTLAGGSAIVGGEVGSKGVIISAVASGVVIAVIAAGSGYAEYQATVAQGQGLIQFFRDVKNGGMGPQFEIRVREIQEALKNVSFMDRFLYRQNLRYNPATYDQTNIAQALVKTGHEILNTKLNLPCNDLAALSKVIDESTMKELIEKFNPQLKAEEK